MRSTSWSFPVVVRLLGCVSVIVVEHSANSLAPIDGSAGTAHRRDWRDQSVVERMMVSFGVGVSDKLVNGPAQRGFHKRRSSAPANRSSRPYSARVPGAAL